MSTIQKKMGKTSDSIWQLNASACFFVHQYHKELATIFHRFALKGLLSASSSDHQVTYDCLELWSRSTFGDLGFPHHKKVLMFQTPRPL